MLDYLAPFFVGFVGSLHCLGMCGPLVVAYSLHSRGVEQGGRSALFRQGLVHHLAFHAGRILSYGFLGGMAAGLFQLAMPGWVAGLRGSVTFGGGIVMILFGMMLLKMIPSFSAPFTDSFLSRFLPRLLRSPGVSSKLAIGLAAGFLPCMLSWAMIIKAASTGNPLQGFFTTALFGLGTIPALFLPGFSATFLSLKSRLYGERIAAFSVMVMGLILVYKGIRYFA